MTKGIGYLGSPSLQTSTANQELVPLKKSHWSNGYRFLKFSFDNTQECSVILNSETTVFLKAGQGFETGEGDVPITSFNIVEADISYNWIGMY